MKTSAFLAVAVVALFVPVAALAQTNVTFTNNDGTFAFDENPSDATYNELALETLSNGLGAVSQLTAISGLSAYGVPNNAIPYPCSPCLGTVSLVTGQLDSGSITSEKPSQYAQFAPGGSFTVSYTNGVSFTGTFTAATWTSAGVGTNTWTFLGYIMNGVLTVNGVQYDIPSAATVQLTTVGAPYVYHQNKKTYTFADNQGTTNFSLAPEPATLTLFGTGLIAVGALTRRRLTAKAQSPQS